MATRIILQGLTASLLLLVYLLPTATARETRYISGTSIDGITKQLAVDRTPALYTGNFGDCLGGRSLFNITKFDAAVSLTPDRVVYLLRCPRETPQIAGKSFSRSGLPGAQGA